MFQAVASCQLVFVIQQMNLNQNNNTSSQHKRIYSTLMWNLKGMKAFKGKAERRETYSLPNNSSGGRKCVNVSDFTSSYPWRYAICILNLVLLPILNSGLLLFRHKIEIYTYFFLVPSLLFFFFRHNLVSPAPGEFEVGCEKRNTEKREWRKKHFVFRHNFQNRLLFIFNRF
jgi:hypothetical protein